MLSNMVSVNAIEVDIAPATLNVNNNAGECITAYIEPSVVFNDNFDDGDALGWQVILGTWQVLNYEYEQIANWYIPGARSFAGDTAWTDYVLVAKVKITDDGWGGLLLRGNAAGNTYYELYLQRGGYLQLTKTVAGSRTWPGGVWNGPQFRVYVGSFADQWWYIRADVNGNNIRGKAWPVSGSEPATWHINWDDPEAAPILNGRIGLITFSWSTTQLPVYFDDVLVTEDINGINVDTIELWHTAHNHKITDVIPGSGLFGDHDGDGIPDLTIKFDRATVANHLRGEGITSGDVELTIKAQGFVDGSDSVRVIAKGKATF